MSSSDLSSVYSLFIQGAAIGAGLGAIAWIIGYTIASIYNLIRRS